jgi:hypothetical protein
VEGGQSIPTWTTSSSDVAEKLQFQELVEGGQSIATWTTSSDVAENLQFSASCDDSQRSGLCTTVKLCESSTVCIDFVSCCIYDAHIDDAGERPSPGGRCDARNTISVV